MWLKDAGNLLGAKVGLVSSREVDIVSCCVSFACDLKAGLSVGTPHGPGPADRGYALPWRRAAEPHAGLAGPAAERDGWGSRYAGARPGGGPPLVGACVLAFVLRQRGWRLASNRRWHEAVVAGRCGTALCFSLQVEREQRGPV